MTSFEKYKREKALIAEAEKYLKENKMEKFNETVKKIKEIENEYININYVLKYIDKKNEEEKKCQ